MDYLEASHCVSLNQLNFQTSLSVLGLISRKGTHSVTVADAALGSAIVLV